MQNSVDRNSKIQIRYLDHRRATMICGTPVESETFDVSPSVKVGQLKKMACASGGFHHDMMALVKPDKTITEWTFREYAKYSRGLLPLEISFGPECKRKIPENRSNPKALLRGPSSLLDIADLRKLAAERALNFVEALRGMKVQDETTLDNLKLDDNVLYLSIDIDLVDKCPTCGSENDFMLVEEVFGFDNIPDLSVRYACSRPRCEESNIRKSFEIRYVRTDKAYANMCLFFAASRTETTNVLPLIESLLQEHKDLYPRWSTYTSTRALIEEEEA